MTVSGAINQLLQKLHLTLTGLVGSGTATVNTIMFTAPANRKCTIRLKEFFTSAGLFNPSSLTFSVQRQSLVDSTWVTIQSYVISTGASGPGPVHSSPALPTPNYEIKCEDGERIAVSGSLPALQSSNEMFLEFEAESLFSRG